MFLEGKNVQVMHQNFINPNSDLNTVSAGGVGQSKTVRQVANKSALGQAYSENSGNPKALSSLSMHQTSEQLPKQAKFRQVGLGLGGGMAGQQTR